MKLDAEILTRQYYETVQDQYPDIDFEEFKKICYNPFEYTKEEMAGSELPVIRLKYFGTFLVYPKRAEAMLNNLKERFRYNKVDKRVFFKQKEMIENFLANESKN
jgi:hypothetical protein